jgi:hypothetical protein
MRESIDRIVEFIAERDPRFPALIRGAAPEEIAQLEAAACRTLPAVYRRFLERMGRNLAWLQIGNGSFDVDSVIRYYEYNVLPDPLGHLLFGRGGGDPRYDYYLWDWEPPGSGATIQRVVSFPPPPSEDVEAFLRRYMRPIAGTLPQLLGSAALATFCHHRLTLLRQVEEEGSLERPRLVGLDNVLRAHDVVPLWFSNDWQRTYERNDLLVTAMESPRNGRLMVNIRAASQSTLDSVYPNIRDYVRSSQGAPA